MFWGQFGTRRAQRRPTRTLRSTPIAQATQAPISPSHTPRILANQRPRYSGRPGGCKNKPAAPARDGPESYVSHVRQTDCIRPGRGRKIAPHARRSGRQRAGPDIPDLYCKRLFAPGPSAMKCRRAFSLTLACGDALGLPSRRPQQSGRDLKSVDPAGNSFPGILGMLLASGQRLLQ